jgi:putative addiction module component (TIGR02574 family)
MSPTEVAELLKLPADERAELAIVLWESLSDGEREAELTLGPEERSELDRRWAEHLKDPGAAVSWTDLQRKLRDRT